MTDYTDAYEIAKVCAISVAKRYGLNFDEAISDAYLAVSEKISRFQPEKAKLTTYVTMIVKREIINSFRKRNAAFRQCVIACGDDDAGLADYCQASTESDDESLVTRLALEIAACGGRPKAVRQSVRNRLTELGWTKNRIAEAFDSLATLY